MIRVHFQDKSIEDYEANYAEVCPDGSLVLAHKSQKDSGVVNAAGQKQVEITSKPIRIIRRDLWAEVEWPDDSKPEIIEIGQRELVRAN